MATKIIPDSFRTLSLDLTEPVDFNFFDESHVESENRTEQQEVEKPTNTVNQMDHCQENDNSNPAGPMRAETQHAAKLSTTTTNSKSPVLSSSAENEQSHHQRNSKSDSPTRSTISASYASDFTNQDTQTKDAKNDDHHSSRTHSIERRIDHIDGATLHSARSRSPSRSSNTSNGEESEMTDVSRVVPYQSTKTSPTCQAKTKDEQPCAVGSQSVTTNDIDRIQTHQLSKVMSRIDRQIKALRIRPPWRDPNSRPLPSDHTASFYDLYDEFTRNTQSLSGSVRCLSQNEIAVCRPYHATLNRYRQQERIQTENYALAKRLQNIRPSPGMTRTEQLREYKRYFIPSTCFTARPPPIVCRPMSSSYRVDHAGDHDSKSTINSKSERSSIRSWSAKPRTTRNTRSAGSRSLISTTDTYESSTSNKTGHSSNKDQTRVIRRGSSSDVRQTNLQNSHRPQKNKRQNSVTRITGARNKTSPTQYDSNLPTATTRVTTDDAAVLPTPPPPTPRGTDEYM